MGLLSKKRNYDLRMLVYEWKVKRIIASVFILDYRSKVWISEISSITGQKLLDTLDVLDVPDRLNGYARMFRGMVWVSHNLYVLSDLSESLIYISSIIDT